MNVKRILAGALAGGAVALGILAGACSNPTSEPSKTPAGKIEVFLDIEGAAAQPRSNGARTLAPALSGFAGYTLSLDEGSSSIPATGGLNTINVAPGTYTITASAGTLSVPGTPVAEGEAKNVEVTSGATTPVTITLAPKTGGADGTLSYDITIPGDLTSAKLNITPLPSGNPTSIDLSGGQNASTRSLAPGYYRAQVALSKGDSVAGLTEVVHIYSGMTSAMPAKEYVAGDFAEPEIVSALDLSSLFVAPARGAVPNTSLSGPQYTGTITWKAGETPLDGNFAASTAYTAALTLTAATGYTFTGVSANSFTYSGAASVANAADSGTVSILFPATEAEPTTVDSLDLSSLVTAPVRGAAAQTNFAGTAQYTGSIAWKAGETPLAGNFAGSTAYTAVITLSPKQGYTFTGVSLNSFTYSGATSVGNAANSGTVSILFPATEADPGTLSVSIGFNYGAITVSGSDGTNAIARSGSPDRLELSVAGFDNPAWYVDGKTTALSSGNAVTLNAADYAIQPHSITFSGSKNGIPYSQIVPFAVVASGRSYAEAEIVLEVTATAGITFNIPVYGSGGSSYNWQISVDGSTPESYEGGRSTTPIGIALTEGVHVISITPTVDGPGWAKCFGNGAVTNRFTAANCTFKMLWDPDYGHLASATDFGSAFRRNQYANCANLLQAAPEVPPSTTITTIGSNFRLGQYSGTGITRAVDEALPASVVSIGSSFRSNQYENCAALTNPSNNNLISLSTVGSAVTSYRANQYKSSGRNASTPVKYTDGTNVVAGQNGIPANFY